MINNYSLSVENVKASLKALDKKYASYLKEDGKWLIGGFESLISIENDVNSSETKHIVLKKEIYMMLPVEIREDISQFIDVN